MDFLAGQWLSVVAIVFVLGLKHGLDPDHLAAIDGLTRFNALRQPRLSRWSGLLFSAGHGAVVTMVAVLVATVATGWRAPEWLEDTGTWISVAFLLVLGLANLAALLRTPPGQVVRPVGLRSRFLARLVRAEHPVLIAAVGAAFALSFDTLGQAVLFSLTGTKLAGWLFAASLGVVFTAGMIATDALNGLWVSRLVRSADARAAAASRAMSGAVALAALAVAGLAVARHLLPSLDERLGAWSLACSGAVVLAVLVAWAIALRRPAPSSADRNPPQAWGEPRVGA